MEQISSVEDLELSKFTKTVPSEDDKDTLEKVDNQINKIFNIIDGNVLPCEARILTELCSRRTALAYSEIDVSFLSMPSLANLSGSEIRVPRFGVSKVFNPSGFAIQFNVEQRGFRKPSYDVKIMLSGSDDGLAIRSLFYKESLIPLFGDHLILSLMDIQDKDKVSKKNLRWSVEYTIHNQPYSSVHEFFEIRRGFESLIIRHPLHTVVPAETKRRIQESRRSFRPEELYFIFKTNPNGWNVERLSYDPLVVGVDQNRGKVYFIDKFNTTLLEERVLGDFLNP